MNIGKTIKLLRELKGLTKSQFAEKSGITLTSVGVIEKGESSLRESTVTMAAKGLSVPPALLYIFSLESRDYKGNKKISAGDFESSITKTRSMLLETCWARKGELKRVGL